MNLIISRQLDQAQKQVIFELTLKKRQSKKSTMSEKQVLARRQLARELMQERRIPIMQDSIGNSIGVDYSLSMTSNDDQSLDELHEEQPSTVSFGTTISSNTSLVATKNSGHLPSVVGGGGGGGGGGNGSTSSTTITTSNSSCSSFSRSDSSYSASSGDSGTHMIIINEELAELQEQTELLLKERKKEANIKFNKTRLEHLNGELERKLHQYEYLVAQEKALLGTYNMMLFTNEGVNNFHLYDALSTPARRLRTYQQQQKSGNKPVHRNSAASSSSASSATTIASNHSLSAKVKSTSSTKVSLTSASSKRAQLNSSASTISNLNTLHMLPSLAGPRRSASSVALMTINQGQIID